MKTKPIIYALLSALLFGISTPAAKVLLYLSNPAIFFDPAPSPTNVVAVRG